MIFNGSHDERVLVLKALEHEVDRQNDFIASMVDGAHKDVERAKALAIVALFNNIAKERDKQRMQYATAKSARDTDGRKIVVGDRVQLFINGAQLEAGGHEVDKWGPIVVVTGIHKQGFDGTILFCSDAPNPDYPHNKQGRASNFRRI